MNNTSFLRWLKPILDDCLEEMGKLIGLEVKARSTITAEDFSGLKSLKEAIGKDFKYGIVLYTGKTKLAFGPDMVALPLTALMTKNLS